MKLLLMFVLFFLELSISSPKLTATPYGVIDSDISYASSDKNSLDLYIPTSQNFPVILFIHGGSFVSGDRKDYPYAQIGEMFQKLGIGCAVMSYRLLQDSVWPAQPRDVAKAIRWLKDNIDDVGGDPSKIFIVGHSSGGHLSAIVCTDTIYLTEVGMNLKDIAGCVSIGAMMSDGGSVAQLTEHEQRYLFSNDWFFKIFGEKEKFQRSLPINHINPSIPKMLLLLADEELYDPPKLQSVEEFVLLSKKYNTLTSYEIIPHRSHMGTVEEMVHPNDITVQKILAFIR